MGIHEEYAERRAVVLEPLAKSVEAFIVHHLERQPRIDRVSARAKSVERFIEKATTIQDDSSPKYTDPINQIQDQVGARIITFYKSDIGRVSELIERYFRPVEAKQLVPESHSSFGYFGKHYVLLIPSDVIDSNWPRGSIPRFFELQIKTLFQHAWAEANHDLGYKQMLRQLEPDELRKLAFTAAQAWGADEIFNQLFEASA